LHLAAPQSLAIAKLLQQIARFRHVVVASRDPSVLQFVHQVIHLHNDADEFL
jgi:hypothetical protein